MKKKILFLSLISTMLLASCTNKEKEDVKETTTSEVSNNTGTSSSTQTNASTNTSTSATTNIDISATTKDDVAEKVYIKIYEDSSFNKLLKSVEYNKGDKITALDLETLIEEKDGYEFNKWVGSDGNDVSIGSRGKILNEDLEISPIYTEIPIKLGTLLAHTPTTPTLSGRAYIDSLDDDVKTNMSTPGFVNGKISDFSVYEDTQAYVKVSNLSQLLNALVNAKETYTTTYNEDGSVTQNLTKEGSVKVIEITADIDLGYNHMTSSDLNTGIVDNFCQKQISNIEKGTWATMSSMWEKHGISQIKIEGTSNLLIYSKNGAKLTHGGFKIGSCTDIAIRNLEFDELWQWEDANTTTPSFTVGDYDSFSWAYMKISNCGSIWIDHCSFGKAFDGIIDISSPDYLANAGIAFRAPYGADGECNIQISNCDFHAGSDDPNGYIYKMMEEIEADYQKTVPTSDTYVSSYNCQYQYYKILRDEYNLTFEEILYGIAIPHKKAFLCGDREDYYEYNLNLNLGISGCTFKNIEDRIPKVRGGLCYMYNSIIDNREYYQYRQAIVDKGAKNINNVYSKFKCGMVSQCFVFSMGSSLYSNNNIILGVSELIKNNEKASEFSSDKYRTLENYETCAGYKYINTYFTNDFDPDKELTSIIEGFPLAPGSDPAFVVNPQYFSWHTDDGLEPFTPVLYKRGELAQKVYDNSGVSSAIGEMFLYNIYG